MTENLTDLTAPSGKTFQVRLLPKHFFLYFGELPANLSEKAVLAAKSGDNDTFRSELARTLSPEQMQRTLIFIREAVNYICVNPRITLTPQNEREISPFDISEADFDFLSKIAMQGAGGEQAAGLDNFRPGQKQAPANRADGSQLRKTSERTARNRK